MFQFIIILVVIILAWDKIKYILGKYDVINRLTNSAENLKEYARDVDFTKESIEDIDERITKAKQGLMRACSNEDIASIREYTEILERLKKERIKKVTS